MHGTHPGLVLVWVFIGGMAGAALRASLPELSVGISWELPDSLPRGNGTASLLPNAIACLLIGALHAGRSRLPHWMPALGIVGFCGGLSTFSAFALELALGLSGGHLVWLASSALIEIVLGLALVWVGDAGMRRALDESGT